MRGMRLRFFLTGSGTQAILGVYFVLGIHITMEPVIMSDPIQSLIRRLEDTLKRQEVAMETTRRQLEAARQLPLNLPAAGGGKK